MLEVLSLSARSAADAKQPWYNRRGVKRKMLALLVIAGLLLTSAFLLRKESRLEDTYQQTRKTTKRQMVAVIAIEAALITVNVVAAKRVVRITQAWRKARIGEVIQKSKDVINVFTHPPPALRPVVAPFQLAAKLMRPAIKQGVRFRTFLEGKAKIAARKYEAKRMLFEQNFVAEAERMWGSNLAGLRA
ncbi:hypothetical protein TeGR_g14831 [Tetraparma gracilis]|uniref:Uncharacterized protein n=1 Tax=Tetraparma gracilis TaxID=2962635 RepID=A0ABQ6M3H7_9STRA|nr:hypothetical protein TeGR_g14831 [Tetraparma gracilis]